MTDRPPPTCSTSTLPAGRDRAESIGSLAERLGWPRRKVERALRELRLAGKPVCTGDAGDHKGVWVTTDPDELRRSADELLEEHIAPIRHTHDAMYATAAGMGKVKQATLWEAA